LSRSVNFSGSSLFFRTFANFAKVVSF